MSSIDEKIGGLMADMRHVREDVSKMLHLAERTNEDLVIQKYKIQEAEERLIKVEATVDGHDKLKNKAFGFAAASGAFGTFVLYLGHTIAKAWL